MSEILVLVDHVDGEVKKPTYELLTIAKPARRAVRGVHRRLRQVRRTWPRR